MLHTLVRHRSRSPQTSVTQVESPSAYVWSILVALAIALPVRATTAQAPAAQRDLAAAARTIISAARYAAFITLDSTGHPQTRTVQPVEPDSAMVVRFATNPRSRKVGEVTRDGRASLYYFDPASLAYVTLVGRARVVRSAAEKSRYWNPAWTEFYPDRDTSVVLIEVTPERLEIVDIKRGITGDALTWRAPALTVRRKPTTRTP